MLIVLQMTLLQAKTIQSIHHYMILYKKNLKVWVTLSKNRFKTVNKIYLIVFFSEQKETNISVWIIKNKYAGKTLTTFSLVTVKVALKVRK